MSVTLGSSLGTGEPISLATADRMLGTYVIGITGTGKSTLILNMIVQDMAAGHGLTLLDPHGDLADDALARVPPSRQGDVIYLDFGDEEYPPGFDIYAAPQSDSAVAQSRQITSSVSAFKKLLGKESWGPRMENLLRMIALAFRDNPGCTMTEIPPLLTNDAFRSIILENITTPVARNFWLDYDAKKGKDAYIESTMTKVNAFLTDPLLTRIVGQPGKVVDFSQAIATNKIVLAKIPAGILQDAPTNFLGSLIVDRIITATLARAAKPATQRPFYALYCDEFERFSSPDFPTFIAEGRKYGIGLLLAHQWRTQLDEDNRSATRSARNSLVFQVNIDDAPAFARGFATPVMPTVEQEEMIPANPWDVLVRKGHPDPEVVAGVQGTERLLARIEHWLKGEWYEKRLLVSQLKPGVMDPLAQYLNVYLYSRLARRRVREPYGTLGTLLLDGKKFSLPESLVYDLAGHLIFLGDQLEEARMDHARKDPTRKLGEISHGLSSLPSFHAKCKLMQGGRVVECTLVTNPPDDPRPAYLAQAIIAESRRRYCTPASEVDRKLRDYQEQLEDLELEEEEPQPARRAPVAPNAFFDTPPKRF